MEAKPFASLSSGLLARKGAARPAMRPQGFGQVGNGLEDLGWNDMGFEPPKPADVARDANHDAFGDDVIGHPRVHPTGLTPVQSPVHDQRAEIVERLTGADQSAEQEFEDIAAEEVDEAVEPEAEAFEPEDVAAPAVEPEKDFAVEFVAESEVVTEGEVSTESEIAVEVASVETIALASPTAIAVPLRRRATRARSAPGSKAKAAFTLRLDPDRHLKLRLACAVDGRSAQQLVTDALDQLLERMPELDGLAAKAKRKG